MSFKKRLILILTEQASLHRRTVVPDRERRVLHDFFADEYERLAEVVAGEKDGR